MRPRPAGPAEAATASESPIIVIGMHRSGTSLVARLLDDMGVQMGRRLDEHHEAWRFKNANRELLNLADSHWAKPGRFLSALNEETFRLRCAELATSAVDDDFLSAVAQDTSRSWGWKDPRNTLTLEVWLEAFPRARIIHVVRRALDTGLSLQRRELRRWVNKSREKRMWPPTLGECLRLRMLYEREAARHRENVELLVTVSYDRLLRAPVESLRDLAVHAGVDVADRELEGIAARRVRAPATRSRLESLRVRLLGAAGLIDERD